MTASVTASMLYDLVSCPHRVAMDLFADPSVRDAPNPFIQLLWEKGSLFEQQVIEGLDVPCTDLSLEAGDEKERLTLEAMQRGDFLIYSGRIQAAGLLGDPDLLRREDDGYLAGDIKSGSGEEGPEDHSRPKKHYAVQLALYTDILERKGLSAGRRAFVWDINGEEVVYDFEELHGKRNPRTLWQDYQKCLAEAKSIVDQSSKTLAAYSSLCKLCHWYTACTSRLVNADDLTLIPQLGRAKSRHLDETVPDHPGFGRGPIPPTLSLVKRLPFRGSGLRPWRSFTPARSSSRQVSRQSLISGSLSCCRGRTWNCFSISKWTRCATFVTCTDSSSGATATTKRRGSLPSLPTSPLRKPNGRPLRRRGATCGKRQSCVMYYYSKYERTIYRKLREKYPDVCTEEELEALFDPERSVDLYYDVVLKATEWPTRDFSIKTLASYLGFAWRDPHPSGAASIEWFHRWVETGDATIRQRILDYNEDDCRATRVLRDGIDGLALKLRKAG